MESQSLGIKQPVQPPPAGGTHSLLKLVLAAVALIILVVVFSGGYSSITGFLGISEEGKRFAQAPEGLLVLSLAPVPPMPNEFAGIFPATYEATRGGFSYVPADNLVGVEHPFTEQYRFSSDSRWAVFLGKELHITDTATTLSAPRVYQSNLSTATDFQSVIDILRAGTMVSDGPEFKWAPVVSDTGDILYMSIAVEKLPGTRPDSWEIIYVPLGGGTVRATQGIYPQWVDSNRFIFLYNDGLYIHNIDTNTSDKLWGTMGTITSGSMIDLSDDKTIIAWSTPESGTVTLLRVLDWNKPTVTLRGVIPVPGLWPTISPDSSMLAILTDITDELAPGSSPLFRIAFYSIETLSLSSVSTDLSIYDPLLTTLTDWRP